MLEKEVFEMNIQLIEEFDIQLKKYTKSYNVINSSYKIGLNEGKILCTLFSLINTKNDDMLTYKINTDVFVFLKENNNLSRLKKIVNNLSTLKLVLENDEMINNISFFSSIMYHKKEKYIQFRFNEMLAPYIVNLKSNFKSYNLSFILSFKSEYSFRFYELLKQKELLGSVTLDIENLHSMLHLPNSYKTYNNFKTRVLIPVMLDLKKYSDVFFGSYTEIKEGKKVVKIKIDISKNLINAIVSLSDFISFVRKNYVNIPLLAYSKGGNVCVSAKGLLYVDNTNKKINKENSLKMWHFLYENKHDLLIDLSPYN